MYITMVEPAQTPEVKAHLEIENYKASQGQKPAEDPIAFWQLHESSMPMLAHLSRMYLCLPGSSVSSERVFSLAGNTISQERASLHPAKADQLIFLTKNAD